MYDEKDAAGYVAPFFDDRVHLASQIFAWPNFSLQSTFVHECIHRTQFYNGLANKLGWMAFRDIAFYKNYIFGEDTYENDPVEVWARVYAKVLMPKINSE